MALTIQSAQNPLAITAEGGQRYTRWIPKLVRRDKDPPPISAPSTLPFEIPNNDVREAFRMAVTGPLNSEYKSNAALDATTITRLAKSVTSKEPEIVKNRTSFMARTNFFDAEYTLQNMLDYRCLVVVSIAHCKDATTAQKMMVDDLDMFQAPVKTVTKRAERRLGQVALQSDNSVFWVRDALWLRVTAEYGSEDFLELVSQTPVPKKGHILIPSRRKKNPVTTMLLAFAAQLDAHLRQSAVPASAQVKPVLDVNRKKFSVACGESFSVRLLNPHNTHELKQAVVEDPDLVMQTANKVPKTAGEYTFFAKKPSEKTTVTLIVAMADTLAVSTVEVEVKIEERPPDDTSNSEDMESLRSIEKFLKEATQATSAEGPSRE